MVFRMLAAAAGRDFLVGGVAFGLLFHTHVITFLVGVVALAAAALATTRDRTRVPKFARSRPSWRRRPSPGRSSAVSSRRRRASPSAWHNLRFPDDYLLFPMDRTPTLLVLVPACWGCWPRTSSAGGCPSGSWPPSRPAAVAFYLLLAWVVLAYLAFVFLMPAVSFVAGRMTLPMVGPGILLAAMTFAAAVRWRGRPPAPVLASAPFLGFMLSVDGLRPRPSGGRSRCRAGRVHDRLALLRDFRPGTRLYATPNKHLVFAVYTGMPVQSVAPVRKCFLDAYDRDVFLIECVVPFQPPPTRRC